MEIDKKIMEEFGRTKKEYDDFRNKRKELGLEDNKFLNIYRMKENFKELKILRIKIE
ncbi:MAG: hypothetical protein ACTSVV_07010 [Promethearchaeota archaeon]